MKKQEKMHSEILLKLFIFFFAFFFFLPPAEAHSPRRLSVQDKILTSCSGDYAILSRGSQKFFFLVRHNSPEATWIEISEFSCLTQQDKKLIEQLSWKEAFHQLRSPKSVYLLQISKNNFSIFVLKKTSGRIPRKKILYPFLSKFFAFPYLLLPLI